MKLDNYLCSGKNSAIALVDCNNFYASCERVFNPALENKPVAVLSNNDGCIIARSNEVKALNIEMGTPFFRCAELAEKFGIHIFSSNYALYGDMSCRVMSTLQQFSDEVEVYSIDEAFLHLTNFRHLNLDDYGRTVRNTVRQWTGIPVSVGIAETKVLAKIANRIAKRKKQDKGYFSLLGRENIDDYLRDTEVKSIWGVGRQYSKMLNKHGIFTARDFKYTDDKWIQKKMTVVGVRLVRELRGQPSIPLEEQIPDKKGICSSRSFGKPVTDINELLEATTDYVTRAAHKLRRQDSVASLMCIYITTNRYKDEPQYHNSAQQVLETPTNDTFELIKTAKSMVGKIFLQGYKYKKVAVLLSGIIPDKDYQLNLFSDYSHHERNSTVLKVMDKINSRFGADCIHSASAGLVKDWQMKRERKSPHYTTNWKELPVIKEINP